MNNTDFKVKAKKFLFGAMDRNGFLKSTLIYFFLTLIGFAFLYPLIHMFAYSLMSESDLINPLVVNIPTSFYFENFVEAAKVLEFGKTLLQTLYVSVIPSLIQVISCSIIAYGFSRHRFFGKGVIMALVVMTFIIPPQVTMIPQLIQFKSLHILGTIWTYILPAIFGQGFKAAVFIMIYFMFFNMMPKSFEEAAKLDGANSFRIYYSIAMPTAIPGIIITFLLSFVWYYNDTTIASLYFMPMNNDATAITTLPMELEVFKNSFGQQVANAAASGGGEATKTANEAIYMAGTFLCIAPMAIVYFFMQRFFVESIDKAGITGE